jgi:type IV pilus assembly protein PilE
MRTPVSASRVQGVTLIELMVVMLIVGILAAIAIPSYRQHTIRVVRTDAKKELMSLSSALERCYTRYNAYDNAACTVGATLPETLPEGTYQITAAELVPQRFKLTATPLGGQLDDTKCTTLSIDHLGAQTATGTSTAQQCWQGR